MAVTYYNFSPSATSTFTFEPQLDGVTYTATVFWLAFAQRYYIAVYDGGGALQFQVPLVGSPNDRNISLSAGYFTTQLVYRVQNNQIEVIS
jgi:hypothetical protein